MRDDLKPLDRACAGVLLDAVRRCGSLKSAARELAMPYSTARLRYEQWGLDTDLPLVTGRRKGNLVPLPDPATIAGHRRANTMLNRAVKSRVLVRPDACSICGDKPGLSRNGRSLIRGDHWHGYDMEHWLDVQWICPWCDARIETQRRVARKLAGVG